MADIPNRLPIALSERLASTSSDLLYRRGKEVDVALAGIPFLLATSMELPYTTETIDQRKDQLDVEAEPGEQSLSTWWRRSQESFHEGAGNLYQESRGEVTPSNGFYESEGLDPWTPGELRLLRKMNMHQTQGAGFDNIRTYASAGTRTNLSTNPNFETSTGGVVAVGNGATAPTLSLDTVTKYSGAQALKVTWQGSGSGTVPWVVLPAATLTSGATYTVSAKVYVPSGSTSVCFNAQGEGYGAGSGTGLSWTTITQTFVADGNDEIRLVPTATVAAGEVVYVDEVLVEEASSVQPYFDGNSSNASWSGAANLSTSTLTIDSADAGVSATKSTGLFKGATPSTLASLHAPAGKTVVDGFISGLNFYTLCSDGTLYQGLISSPGTASNWSTASGMTRMAFGKHRLWAIGGRRIFQPDLGLASGSAQTVLFTHPNQGWNYTCMAEGPAAMYFGGHDGRSSSIQAIALDSGGGVPTLTGAQVTTALPDGELVQELAVLAGQYVGIGTNRGFRVGVVDGTNIVYGPILFAPEGTTRCTAIGTQDRFFLVSFDSPETGAEVWKVDTGLDLGDGIFPYAKDVTLAEGSATSLAVWGTGSQVLATDTLGYVWEQSATELVENGYLRTGRIRFRTNERKLFKYIELDTDPLYGTIKIDGWSETDSTFQVQTFAQEGESGTSPISLTSVLGPQRHVGFTFTLARDAGDSTRGPVLRSYLVRALPTSKPQRMITVPVLCYDRETAHSGQRYGYEGYATERLEALQAIEDVGDTLIFQDFGLLDGSGTTVVIDSMRFVQTAANTKTSHSGRGGILVLNLRTVNA